MQLTLKRAGTFTANWNSGSNVCGHGKSGEQTYNYSCEIVSDSKHLDPHGFIVDQLDVDRTFRDKYYLSSYPVSCEQMAIAFVYEIQTMVIKHQGVGTVKRVVVSVGPIPPKGYKGEAAIIAEWTL